MLQSIDKKFIISVLILLLISISKSFGLTLTNLNTKDGIITLMYHRFNEEKYPSTNIQNDIFLEQLEEINNLGIKFITFEKFQNLMESKIDNTYLLLTIDDAFESFYLNAWPLLKSKKIPFILFVSTREIGKNGYMTWEQIRELESNNFVEIGNHSHSHEYLVDWDNNKIKSDLNESIKIFNKELGYSPIVFSYPFGEYSNDLKKITSDLGFKFAFGQHSGVLDLTKNPLELPRFPINEKYGDLERFKFLINLLPFQFKEILPQEKLIINEQNPPDVVISFFDNQKNLNNINCYSNENDRWRKSNLLFLSETKIRIVIKEKFTTERGRINCSLNDSLGWRWFGIQFVIL